MTYVHYALLVWKLFIIYFFVCPFSSQCVDIITAWVGVKFKPIATMDFQKFKFTKLQQNILSATYASTIHEIWTSRNIAVWSNLVLQPSYVVRRIQHEIRLKLVALQLDQHPNCKMFL